MNLKLSGVSSNLQVNSYTQSTRFKNELPGSNIKGAVSGSDETSLKEKDTPVTSLSKESSNTDQVNVSDDPKVQQQIQDLLQIQNKVIIHEQAHMAAGGDLAGGASYSYTTGPDGKRYITGGEVSISVPGVDDPEEEIALMKRVISAAMAPADPSPQDVKTASAASAKQAEAYSELNRKKAIEAYGTSKNAVDSNAIESKENKENLKDVNRTLKGKNLDISV